LRLCLCVFVNLVFSGVQQCLLQSTSFGINFAKFHTQNVGSRQQTWFWMCNVGKFSCAVCDCGCSASEVQFLLHGEYF
jgi:hypothetical protein